MHLRLDAFQFCIKQFFVPIAELVQSFSHLYIWEKKTFQDYVESLIYSWGVLQHEQIIF